MDELAELNSKRLLVARMITADNDYTAINAVCQAAFKREYNYNVPIPQYRIQHHVIRAEKRAWFALDFARKDVKAISK